MKIVKAYKDRTTGEVFDTYEAMIKDAGENYDVGDPTNAFGWEEHYDVIHFIVDNEPDGCKTGEYNCDACPKNGDCLAQGIDGRPIWMESEDECEKDE